MIRLLMVIAVGIYLSVTEFGIHRTPKVLRIMLWRIMPGTHQIETDSKYHCAVLKILRKVI